jgi:type I restriction enzyme S subunit
MSSQGLASNNNQVPEGYKKTEVGVIPEDWEVDQLSNITQPKRPISYGIVQTGKPVLNGVKCIRVVDIINGKIDYKNLITTSEKISRHYKRTILLSEDLVIALRGKIGELAVISKELEGANLTRGVALIALKDNHLSNFYHQYLSSLDSKVRLESSLNGSALQELPIATLRSFRVAIPPLPEQKAIAQTLSDVDALIAALDKLIAKKRNIKTATMQQLLTGKTRLPGFGGEWEQINLGNIAEIISGGTPKTTNLSYWNGNIKWCTPTDITGCKDKYLLETERTISYLGLKNSGAQLLPAGTLLLCSRATIGEVKIASCEICTNQGFKSIICSARIDNEFLYYKLLTMKQQMIERAFGSTFLEISKLNVAALELSIPLPPEQKAIAQVLSDIDTEITALEKRRAKTQAIKQGMMQELLTGRTRLINN